MWQSLSIVIIAVLVLLIGHRWGTIAIAGSSIERDKNPVLYVMAMATAWLLLVIGLTLLITGN